MNQDLTKAVCSGIMTVEQPTPPLPPAPLVRAEVVVTLEIRRAPDRQPPPVSQDALDWFTWEEIPLFPCPLSMLVCRDRQMSPASQAEEQPNAIGRLDLYFSIHPLTAEPLDQGTFRIEAEKAVRVGMENRFRCSDTATISNLAVVLQFDPGIVRHTDAYIGSKFPGSPRIILGKSYDWGVKTCYLTDEHFYPPAPLAFLYDGDPSKPVSPNAALRLGFTISSELLRALSARLNSADNLTALPGDISFVEACDNNYGGPSELEETLDNWGGAINKWFATRPAIPPEQIAAAVAEAKGASDEASMARARAFLRNSPVE